MKISFLATTLFFMTVSLLNAQQYFDNNWKECTQDKALYVAVASEGKANEYIVRTLIKGELSGEKKVLSKNYSIYKTNDFQNGEMVTFTENGDTVSVKNYFKGNLEGDYKLWREDHGLYKKAFYREGKEDGITEYFFPNGQVSARYIMIKGKEKESEFWNADASKLQNSKEANRDPSFMGKDKRAFSTWIGDRLVYPLECKKLNIEGTVVVSLRISLSGKIEDVQIVESPHYLLSAEALRVIEDSPIWAPGIRHNQITGFRYTIPVVFRFSPSKS